MLKVAKKAGKIIGIKIVKKTIIKYTVPGVSIVIGGSWNYVTTRKVGTIAVKHFKNKPNNYEIIELSNS